MAKSTSIATTRGLSSDEDDDDYKAMEPTNINRVSHSSHFDVDEQVEDETFDGMDEMEEVEVDDEDDQKLYEDDGEDRDEEDQDEDGNEDDDASIDLSLDEDFEETELFDVRFRALRTRFQYLMEDETDDSDEDSE